mmetsp:Transcript_28093/g.44199  ORF Transcript_28093/g.44199 Transcript_28093/m.44199 type:complete len:139 (+) Transcript_28093:1124-1540(+)
MLLPFEVRLLISWTGSIRAFLMEMSMSDCEAEEDDGCCSSTSCVHITSFDNDAVELAGERDRDRNADTFGSPYDLPDNAAVSLCFFSVVALEALSTTSFFDTDESSVFWSQLSPSSVEDDDDKPNEKKGGKNDPGKEA